MDKPIIISKEWTADERKTVVNAHLMKILDIATEERDVRLIYLHALGAMNANTQSSEYLEANRFDVLRDIDYK